MADWVQVALALMTVLGSVAGSVALVSFRTGTRFTEIDAAIKANAIAISELTRAVAERATAETAKGLQAQLTRQEGALTTTANELGARIERHGIRVDKVEETHAARESATAAVLGRLEAIVGGLKESVERLIAAEADRHRAPPPSQPSLIDQLRQFAELQAMLKKTA